MKEKREIGLISAITLNVGTMIGAGIFTLSGLGANMAGPAVSISFILASLVALLTALSYIELSTLIPKSGGGYQYVKESFGKFTGFITGWIFWFGYIAACFVYAFGFGKYFSALLGLPLWISILIPIASISVLNLFGTKLLSQFQNWIVFIIIGGLIVFIVSLIPSIHVNLWEPFFPTGWRSVAKASGMLFITFLGFEVVSSVGGKVKTPKKTLPKAILISILLVTVIYSIVSLVMTGILPFEVLGFKGPVEVISHVFGAYGFLFLSLIALLATTSSLNASLLAASHVSLSLSRDSFLPKQFSKMSKYNTPIITIGISAAMISSFVLTDLVTIISYTASINFIIGFIFVNLAAILLRYKTSERERAFKVPGYPITQLVATFLCVIMLLNISFSAWLISLGWLIFGLGTFSFWYSTHPKRRSHLIRGIKEGFKE